MEDAVQGNRGQLRDLLIHGEAIFGSVATFKNWLNMPAYGLGNQIPYSLLKAIGGIDLIDDELCRIEFGALA